MKLLLVAAATVALVGGGAAYASADDLGATANKTVSNKYGSITHIDKGDKFKVCDTYANGKGVVGRLSDTYEILKSEEDGGDAGCDYFSYNVREGKQYLLQICGKPATIDTCTSGFFYE